MAKTSVDQVLSPRCLRHLLMDEDVWAMLKDSARRTNTNPSALVRKILRVWYVERLEGAKVSGVFAPGDEVEHEISLEELLSSS